jgi:transposase
MKKKLSSKQLDELYRLVGLHGRKNKIAFFLIHAGDNTEVEALLSVLEEEQKNFPALAKLVREQLKKWEIV